MKKVKVKSSKVFGQLTVKFKITGLGRSKVRLWIFKTLIKIIAPICPSQVKVIMEKENDHI